MRALCLLAFALAPTTALACVTADDLATGIRFGDAEGSFIDHRSLDDTRIEQIYDFGGGVGIREVRLLGLHILFAEELTQGEVQSGTQSVYTYQGGETALPRPETIQTFTAPHSRQFGGESSDWTFTYSAEASTTTELNGCSYETRLIRIENQGDTGGGAWEEYLYFIDLGTAHLSGYGFGERAFDSAPISLETIE